jgi:hypothetical protein
VRPLDEPLINLGANGANLRERMRWELRALPQIWGLAD